jgi:plasmid stability protein
MPTLSIKDVPEPVAQALREKARLNHRSLQGELMAMVMQAIQPGQQTSGSSLDGGYPVGLAPAPAGGLKTIEQIARERLGRRGRGDRSAPRSGARIRADRDSR